MSLKNIAGKIIACFIAIYMVLGNIMMTGIEMSKVIAEEANIPQITLLSELQKYVQYSNELGKGAVIQTKLSLGEESSKDTHKNISKTEIQIDAPKIDGILPERVNIIAANTKLTNGKEEGEINQNYNKETGLLNIFYENQANYQDYIENAKDEFEIIYIYPQLAYKASEEKINVEIKGEVKREYRLENSTVSNNKVQIDRFELSKNIGEIVNYEVICTSDIYKGYLYANEENKTNYETEYKNTAEFSVLNNDVTEQTKLILGKTSFIDKENKETATDAVVYKSSKISEKEFNKMFGQDGWVNFYIGNTKYATINYSEADKDGNRTYQTYYHVEGIENNEAGKVVYPEGTLEVIIETSKPQTEGTLSIENEKVIKAKEDYGIKVEDIVKLKEITKIEENKNYIVEEDKKDEEGQVVTDENGNIQKQQVEKVAVIASKENTIEIEVKEPQTQVDLSVDNIKLSTLTENNIKLTATLRTDSEKYRLFKNPTIKIELPDGIESISSSGIKLLYGQETIKIKNAKIQNNKTLIIEIEGNQNQYNVDAIQEGASIIIPLTIKFDMTTPTQDSKIKLFTTNNKETVQTETNINLISKKGLMSITNLYRNSNNSRLTIIDNEQKEIILDTGKAAETARMESTIVNDFGIDLKNVIILGKISETEEINITLKSAINVGKNIKVYYSENNEAKATDNIWKEKVEDYSKIKSYMIIIDSLKQKEKFAFNYDFTIPQKLEYNKKTNVKYNVYYNYEYDKQETTSRGERILTNIPTQQETVAVTLRTEDVPNVSVEIKPNISLDYVHEGQIVEYIIKVKNEGDQVAEKLEIEDVIPNGTTYAEYTTNDFDGNHTQGGYGPKNEVKIKTIPIDKLDVNETKEVSIFLKINDIDGKEDKEIENIVNVNAILTTGEKKCIKTASVTTEVKETKIKAELKYMDMSNNIREGAEVRFYLYITNNSDAELKNLKIVDELDKDILINKEKISGNEISNLKLDDNNRLSFNIANINSGETTAVVIYGTIVNNSNYSTKILRNRVIVQSNGNEDYETNPIYYEVVGSDVSASITSNTKTNVKEKDEIEYNIVIKNLGDISRYITLSNEMSDEISIKYVEIQYNDETSKEKIVAPGKLSLSKTIESNQTIKIKMVATVEDIGNELTSKEVSNVAIVDVRSTSGEIVKTIRTDTITNVIEKVNNNDSDNDNDNDSNSNDNNTEEPDKIQDEDDKNDNSNNGENKYTIRGTAWLDSNKNGQKDSNEKLLSNIKVKVIDANTNKLIKKEDGTVYSIKTSENGTYLIEGLSNGIYILVFEYDTSIYSVTVYKKDGVNETVNSDVINKNVTINGETKLVALTDNIKIENLGVSNIDIGLIENVTFDLSLDKQISSITVTNVQGTKTTEYDDQKFAKIDLVAKYMNNTNVIISYKFVITNNGDVTGYVDKLVDNLPTGLEFSSELNKDWYKGEDGNLYTKSLNGIAIKPGEATEVELILTKKTTENTTGTFTNNAELKQISNLEAIEEKTDAQQNNKSSADVVISIKTGSAIMYMGITIGCIAVIATGAYTIKKKVLIKIL